MIFKNLKTFLQHLLKNKLYSLITIFGFSVSLMFIILLSVYIEKEYSVDQFHKNKDRIFRVVHGDQTNFAPPSGPLLLDKLPEVQAFTRTKLRNGFLSRFDSEKLKTDYLLADSSFFSMFSFPLIKGHVDDVLQRRNSMVLSQSFARKLFGKIPELGEVIKIDNKHDFILTGIMEDFPEDTHFKKIDVIIDFLSLQDFRGSKKILETYNSNSFGLYLLAKENTDLVSKADEMLSIFKEVNWMFQRNYATDVGVEPLTDVYFSNCDDHESKRTSKSFLEILTCIILMILILSVINYVNLTIAQSSFRCKEIAIKKLIGGKKRGLLLQSLVESILLSVFSLLVALVLCFQFEGIFNDLLNTNIELASSFTFQGVLILLGFVVIIGVVSGIVPAIKIAGFDPLDVLKGKFRMKEKNTYSRLLICFQYVIIIILIICSFFISKQTSFLRNYQLGFEQENMLKLPNYIPTNKRAVFTELLKNIQGIEAVSFVRGTPLDGGNNNSFTYNDKQLSFQQFVVDTSFFDMMNMEVHKTGVAYSKDIVWLNESAVKAMDLPSNPQSAKIYDKEVPVYGVVKDFHFRDLKSEIGPAYFGLLGKKSTAWSIVIKLKGTHVLQTVENIRKLHYKFTDGIPIEINFFDATVQKWYEREERTGQIVNYLALLTIIISVMGLFAMSLYYVQQKKKEIGVRKVNGAKTFEIISLLNRDFIKWVAVAFVIACPVAYYAMDKWLESFAYKTELSWWIFALAGIIAMGIALLTVSLQSWKAATRNPVECLRYE